MINIYEYLLSKKNKTLNKLTNDNIHDVIKDTLKALGPNADLNFFDTSEITKMDDLFNVNETGCVDFNGDVSGWDVSYVYTFDSMFENCKKFDCDLSRWELGKQSISMDGMFFKCESFNQDISSWNLDAQKLKRCASMFKNCETFEQDLSSWKMNKCAVRNEMFKNSPLARRQKLQPQFV